MSNTNKELTVKNLQGVWVEDTRGYPNCPDAWISYAEWMDGTELTKEELEAVNNDSALVRELVWEWIHGS